MLAGAAGLILAGATPRDPARVFDKVWGQVDRYYWDAGFRGVDWTAARARFRPQAIAAPDTRALYRVLNAMLALIGDSHVFAEAPAARRRDDARRDGDDNAGFGIATGDASSGWRIFAVSAGSPAARAGVQIGWMLVSVGGRDPDTDWHPAIGDRVALVFRDETGAAHRLDLIAAPIAVEPARAARMLANGVLLLRINGFDAGDARWIANEIGRAAPSAVILDLRENGGGGAIEGARVAGRFFTEKRTLLRRIERRRSLDVPILGAGRNAFTGSLAILIGPRSASAAEAVAALVAESGRGVTVGERSAGALTGAIRVDLPDGGLLSLAEADVRTPAGARIEGVGLAPLVPVTPTLADLRSGRDPVLARAVVEVSK